ncbi:hypothetical protein [Catenulispora subtropica]|uniref:Ion transport domain-containing protein n=1 Tax=Catenulispora subtropica TaxID=450798 RepID=A0ABN2SZ39_9ACTN
MLDVAFDLSRARARLQLLNIIYGLVTLVTCFAMWVDRYLWCECDRCDDRMRLAEFIAPRLFTIEAARCRARDHIRTATFALSWVTLTPFRYYVPMAVLAAPIRPPLRVLLRLVRIIAALFELAFDAIHTGLAMLAVLRGQLEKLPRPHLPLLPWLRWPRIGRRGSAPRLSRRLTNLATLVLPAADQERYSEEWHEELLGRSRIRRAFFVIGVWLTLSITAWRLHAYGRRQPV